MRLRSVLAIVFVPVAIVVSGCGAEASQEPAAAPQPQPPASAGAPSRVLHLTVAGERAVLATPQRPRGRAVLYLHSSGAQGDTILTDPVHIPLAAALLRAGYAIAGSNAGGEAWGNERSVAAYAALAEALRRRGYSRLYILAESMGGLAGVKVLGRVRPRAWIGLAPACDLRSVYARFGPLIDAAYGGHAPLGRIVPSRTVAGLPMLFRASGADSVVPKAENTDRCAADLRRRGARVRIVGHRGDHGDPSIFAPAQLVAFYDAH